MKKKIYALAVQISFTVLLSCTSNQTRPIFHNQEQFEICSMLYDIKGNRMVSQIGKKCDIRTTPCSTFKVPLFLFALQDGLITNLNTSFKWDGKKQFLPEWNKDQTARSWMQNSTVWVSQYLTSKMGMQKVKQHLDTIKYGNANPYSALDSFWLTKSPFSYNADSSLKISPEEQLEFLNKIWMDKLPGYTTAQMDLLQEAIRIPELDQNGLKFYGKTGSGYIEYNKNKRLGWFVGYVMKGEQPFSVVIKIEDKYPQPEPSFAGSIAKEMVVELVNHPDIIEKMNKAD